LLNTIDAIVAAASQDPFILCGAPPFRAGLYVPRKQLGKQVAVFPYTLCRRCTGKKDAIQRVETIADAEGQTDADREGENLSHTTAPGYCKTNGDPESTAGQPASCCHSHAKVVAMEFAAGQRLSIEGSSNLCGNGSGREQFAMINDPALQVWHSGWIAALVKKHEGDTS
jgi:hypothetical protein